jgi:thiaminase
MESIAAVSFLNGNNSTVVPKMASQSAKIVLHIQRETALHVNYCASFGLSKEEMEKLPEKMGE